MGKAMFVYDKLDILSFVQTTGEETVDAFDASVDDVTTTGVATNVLDLGAAVPNYIGQSLYVRPLKDVNGEAIAGTGNPVIIATLFDGATTSPVAARATATQAAVDETLELPLPQDVKRYVKVGVKSNGGGASNAIVKGAVQVFIGPSNQKG